ncbi:MAG TPA: amidohydrolase family protein [Terracidiphilus sp.]|nr:amidohydrolase family protein [Terracidiphilus sp.]
MIRRPGIRRAHACAAAVLTLLLCIAANSQNGTRRSASPATQDIDPQLHAVIERTPAFDNHAHPVLPSPAGGPHQNPDRDFDALPVDNMAPETDPVAWRPDNPQLADAWAALFGFHGIPPLDTAGMKELEAERQRVRQREQLNYSACVLQQAGIGTMLANRVSMGPGIEPPHFRWVPYADALLFPLDNSGIATETPDRAQFFPLEDRLRARYLAAVGLKAIPATLDEYLSRVVTPTLERQRKQGAVAEKFEIAYLRSFGFSDPSRAEAARIYAQWAAGGTPDSSSYKLLQDFLFRYIATECGRLGMAVHLHTMSGGGSYFGIAGANPLLLEPVFNDGRLRNTRFVMLHGGWPFVREAGALLQKPNVYLDLSQQALTFPPRTLAGWLREWLETYPDKVLFGTDGYPFSDAMGWEEATWIASRNAREALGLALTGMMHDGEVSRARAEEIAQQVLRKTAESLYGPTPPQGTK